MKISTSTELVWQLAAKEAIAGNFAEIDPDHFFLALLKFSGLPTSDLDHLTPADRASSKPSDEVKFLNDVFARHGINSTTVRRALRSHKGRGSHPFTGRKVHRSEAARKLFEKAVTLLIEDGGQLLTTKQLFEAILLAPTPLIAQFLPEAMGPEIVVKQTAPLLSRHGIDAASDDQRQKNSDFSNRKAEAIALMQMLKQPHRPCVFLVNKDDSIIQTVVRTAACLMAEASCPQELKGNKIMDVSSIVPMGVAFTAPFLIADMKQLFTEAAAAKHVILSGLPFASFKREAWPDELSEALEKLIQTSGVRCIIGVSPKEYDEWVKKDPSWKKLSEAIWIRDKVMREIPTEI